MGRPSKFTPEREQRLLDEVRSGNSHRVACRAAGITEETLSQWRRHKPVFAEAFMRAEAESEADLVAEVRHADDWRAKAWLLERRFPETWSQRQRLEVDVQQRVQQLASSFGVDPDELLLAATVWSAN